MSFSRRTLLRGLGTAIALPWMESLAAAERMTATARPIRLGFVYLPNGMHMPDWKPRGGSATAFETPKIFQPVEKFREQTTIISNLALRGANPLGDGPGDHARSVAAFLTGAHPRKTRGSDILNGKSVDQVAAEKVGHLTRWPSLELGTESSAQAGRCDSGYSCAYTSNISWRTPTSPMAKEMDPAEVFARLFGNTDALESKIARNKRIARRQSILDFVREDARNIERRLAVRDRQKLDEYLYAIRSIEKRLGQVEKLDQSEAEISNFQRPVGVPASYGQHVKLMLDMMTLAFQTDSTRIISFMFANAGSNRSYREIGVSGGHHDISHHGNSKNKKRQISEINQYHMQLFSHLLERLASIEEGESTLLDHCLILYGSGISDGNRHNHENLPIALFGGGERIATGHHLEMKKGTPLTNLYCSMLDEVGAGVDQFSDSTGRIAGLSKP